MHICLSTDRPPEPFDWRFDTASAVCLGATVAVMIALCIAPSDGLRHPSRSRRTILAMNVGALIHVVFNYVSSAPWIPGVKLGTGFCVVCDVWMILYFGFNLWFNAVINMIWNAIANGVRERLDPVTQLPPSTRCISIIQYGLGVPMLLFSYITSTVIFDTFTSSSYYDETLESCTTKPWMKLVFVSYFVLCLSFLFVTAIVSQYYIRNEPVIRKTCKSLSILAAALFLAMLFINLTNITVYPIGRLLSTCFLALLYCYANVMFVQDLVLDGKEFSELVSVFPTLDQDTSKKDAAINFYMYAIQNDMADSCVKFLRDSRVYCNYHTILCNAPNVPQMLQDMEDHLVITDVNSVGSTSLGRFLITDDDDEDSGLTSAKDSENQQNTSTNCEMDNHLTEGSESAFSQVMTSNTQSPGHFVVVNNMFLIDFMQDLTAYYRSTTYSSQKQMVINILDKYYRSFTQTDLDSVADPPLPNLNDLETASSLGIMHHRYPPVPLPTVFIQNISDTIQDLTVDQQESNFIPRFAQACTQSMAYILYKFQNPE